MSENKSVGTTKSAPVTVEIPERDIQVDVQVSSLGASVRRQAVFWTGAMAFLALFLYIFSSILLPFVAGLVLAYFLDPVADRLERLGLSRLLATIVILVLFIVTFALLLVILVPVLASQMSDFIARLPSYVARLQELIANPDSQWLKDFIGVDASVIRNSLDSLLQQGAGFLTTLLQSIWSSGKTLIDVVALFVVTPVVAFYMLLDWDRMVAKIDNLVPREHVQTVRAIARDMNKAIAGFVRGQGTVCLLLGIIYAVGLTVVGLNFGLLIGLFAGLISFIPYVGSLIGLLLALGVGTRPVLAGMGPYPRRGDCFRYRPVHRRQYSPAEARGFLSRSASGLADVRIVRLWLAHGVYRHAHCRTDGCCNRRTGSFCHQPLSAIPALHRRIPQKR